jgi:hydrogenase maturation protein HypF
VYHHHAHIASVMAEHKLEKVLGVAFDGAGYGEDGTVWGGEFLICEGAYCRRAGHLKTVKMLGTDAAAKDALMTAACYLYAADMPFDHPYEDMIKKALAHDVNTFYTTSMGRLFDAVSALLNVCHENSYEGECAVRLQYMAEAEYRAGTLPMPMAFTIHEENRIYIASCDNILRCCLSGKPGAALGFHRAVCDMAALICVRLCEEGHIPDIALSGGVFQNALLLEMLAAKLTTTGFNVFVNEAVPPGDSGLALGQAFIASRSLLEI